MTYTKQNFISGQKLKAEHMNHIENGISQLSDDIEKIVDDKNFDELKMLVEANIINILSDNNNTILADNDGKIYVL